MMCVGTAERTWGWQSAQDCESGGGAGGGADVGEGGGVVGCEVGQILSEEGCPSQLVVDLQHTYASNGIRILQRQSPIH